MQIQSIKRFKSRKKISMVIDGRIVWMTFAEAREFIGYVRDMLEGDLIEVKMRSCGCLERKTK